jgi:serine/threonine protein kinase
MPTEGDVLNHRYRILRVLSDKGGMGVIYQATDLSFNNTVVIKHSRFTEQFLK